MIAFFANIFGYLLNFLYNVVGNYGVAIILFSLIVKALMIPLSIKQQKTVKKNEKIQAEMKQIQFKYKNDPEKLNQETIALYKRENMSPFGGCFSAIIQIVLLFAVFYLVRSPLTHMKKIDAETIGQYQTIIQKAGLSQNTAYPEIEIIREIDNIKELKNKEDLEEEKQTALENIDENELNEVDINMSFFGLDLSKVPTQSAGDWTVYIIPVLYVLSSVLSMKLTNQMQNTNKSDEEKNEMDEAMAQANKSMSLMMPIMSVSIALIAPLGLALYWLINNILMLVEKLVLSKVIKNEEEV